MKNKFSIIIISLLFNVIDSPVKSSEKGIKRDIMPIDWKKISATILPLNPRRFLMSWFSGNIKFGSSGE